jgi:type 1 glutamine amidotransferase
MKMQAAAVLFLTALAGSAQSPQPPRKRRVLAVGDTSTRTYQHASISHAMATIERLGRQSGLYETVIRTDTQLLTKKRLPGTHTLDDFDAIFFYSIGEPAMTPDQKADLLSFIREDGKGFVGTHTANNDFFDWPEYTDLIGGRFDDHPWELFEAPVIVEDPSFPAMKAFPPQFTINDEIYQVKDYSRNRVRVLARLNANELDLGNKRVHRTDRDFAVAWARSYGKGRVYYSTFGHRPEVWDRKDIQMMYREALKWAMGITEADVTPRPLVETETTSRVAPLRQIELARADTSTQRLTGQPPKTILALADVSTADYQHDSLSHALSTIEEMGLRADLCVTLIRTDPQLVTSGEIAAATGTLTFYKNLQDFDAVVLLTEGEPKLTPQQKSDLLSFVRDGKGLVAIHSAIGSFRGWPEFAGLIGGHNEEHPAATEDWDVTVLETANPLVSLLPKSFRIRDNFSPVALQKDAHVLAQSGDGTPVVWTRSYGKGRVFASQIGHEDSVWDRRDVQHLYLEGIRWAIGQPVQTSAARNRAAARPAAK